MSDKFWIIIANDDYWVEGADWEEMLYAVRDRLESKFKKRDRTWVVSTSPEEAAVRLRPFRLIRALGDSEEMGELISSTTA